MLNLFKRYDVELFSEVRGQAKANGKPLAGVEVTRSVSYEDYKDGKEQLSKTTTDSNGNFSFPPLVIKSSAPGNVFGQNMSILQSVTIKHEDRVYFLWAASKRWKPSPAFSSLLSKLQCDLSDQELTFVVDTSVEDWGDFQTVESLCRWEDNKLVRVFEDKDYL
ncbi:hypothetical protein GCM10025776_09450 [Corallincola platygyrae]